MNGRGTSSLFNRVELNHAAPNNNITRLAKLTVIQACEMNAVPTPSV